VRRERHVYSETAGFIGRKLCVLPKGATLQTQQ
jgi:hypothetical protein